MTHQLDCAISHAPLLCKPLCMTNVWSQFPWHIFSTVKDQVEGAWSADWHFCLFTGSEETCGGLANILFNPFASVEGCVFLLTPADLNQLDAFTGAPQVASTTIHYSVAQWVACLTASLSGIFILWFGMWRRKRKTKNKCEAFWVLAYIMLVTQHVFCFVLVQ